jgi:hypothetical protein
VQAFAGASATGNYLQLRDGRFLDDRWVGGRWDLAKFAKADGETDWDAVSAVLVCSQRVASETIAGPARFAQCFHG